MYAALRSQCLQDYPEFEILFGISDENDPAAKIIHKLMQELPDRNLQLVHCPKNLGANGKVGTLAQLAKAARHELFVVNDSDIRVEPNYLLVIAAELQRPHVGLVTCLYRGLPSPTLSSRLEALGISTDFAAGVLAAKQLEGGLHFGLGSTLAFRRRELEAIGGFEAMVEHLADDYELGRRIANLGLKVELSQAVVETHLPAYNLSGFFSHQLRWARTIRASRPGGYAGLLLTFTLPWALATVALARGALWAWGLFAAAFIARLATAATCACALQDRITVRFLWLLPLRDLLAVATWAGGWLGNTVVWRGERFYLKHGKLRRSSS
jgi:ceramide glucosyltransferase